MASDVGGPEGAMLILAANLDNAYHPDLLRVRTLTAPDHVPLKELVDLFL